MQTQPIQYLGTGRRKLAVARVFLRHGTGTILINRRPMEEYFPGEMHRALVKQPLQLTETLGKFDILITAHGGGLTGQADAAKMGIARALQLFNAELRAPLKKALLLRRDPRKHERKKYGRPGARKRFQFSKR